MRETSILVLGAGPTGLGAATRLLEAGHTDWLLLDRAANPGGLARSIVDEQGFTWDMGGHVLFSHYEYFDRLLDALLPNGWNEHSRESWVWMRDRFIPYPLQMNLHRLPPEDVLHCVRGLLNIFRAAPASPPADFHQWILNNFGQGLADVFMVPYNQKVWAYHPKKLTANWMGERVATVDLARVLENIIHKKDDLSWGPNARFRFPIHGGTGAIWHAAYETLPAENCRLKSAVKAVDSARRIVHLADGDSIRYEKMISTLPMDQLIRMLTDRPELSQLADQFVHSSSHIIGVGMTGQAPESLKTKSWMYFPEPEAPFYRVTVFSNYSKYNVPEPDRQWSLMCEVSESPDKPVNLASIKEDTIEGLRHCHMIDAQTEIVSVWHERLEYGYPTPFIGRDELLHKIEPQLRVAGIWSRGRFGGWKYEVSNQDHSLMQGVEAVEHILNGTEEATYFSPSVVNSTYNRRTPV